MSKHQPPKLARKIFEWYCDNANVDDLLGDMDEWFYKNLERQSPSRAKARYWKQVFSLLFSYAIWMRKKNARYSQFASSAFSLAIVKNYFVVASRSLYRQKYFTIINAVGLAVGMSISLLLITMFTYVSTFDNFHKQKSNIYRITTSYKGDHDYTMASAPAVLAEKLRVDFTSVNLAARINSNFSGDVSLTNVNVPIQGYYTDPDFLSIFSFELVQGNAREALKKPNSMVITESAAKKLFGDASALGNSIEVLKQGIYEITGVLKDPPINSHMAFECLVSFSTLPIQDQDKVINYIDPFTYKSEFVYFLMNEATHLESLEDYLHKISEEASKSSEADVEYGLQALGDITPSTYLSMVGGLGSEWDMNVFYFFGTICLLILIPACFNYANISIARALKRAKEIGLRKTMGGQRNQIFFQFITETVVISTVSLLGAIPLFFLIRKEFQSMLVDASSLDLSLTWTIAGLFLLFAIVTGFMAGAAPAFYFAGLNPIQALKSQSSTKIFSGMWMRKSLAVFQFIISFGFIVALIVFSRQYRYSMNYDFGFQQENILDVELQGADPALFDSEFSKLSPVHSISFSSDILGFHNSVGDSWMRFENQLDSFRINEMFIDHSFIENLGLKIIAGSNFPDGIWNREQHIIVNEQFLKIFNIPTANDAIGKVVSVNKQDLEIIGVLKDFHFSSLRDPIKSFAFRVNPARYQFANLKVAFTDVHDDITDMEQLWKGIGSQMTFKAKFFRDEINEAYEVYVSIMKTVGFLGLLAISITLLGMLGMVIYTSEMRTKEVGIRKVFGASVASITYLLSKDYLKLMGWAFIIGIPLAVVIIDTLLAAAQHYRVQLSVWDILAGMAILMILGLLTVSTQTVKAANANPAETLKNE